MFDHLKERIDSRHALVGIIGLGYVGLPLAHALHAGGLRILGFDSDPRKIESLAKGENYLNTTFFEEAPNKLLELVPSAGKWEDTVRVIDAADVSKNGGIRIIADALHQKVSCHFAR